MGCDPLATFAGRWSPLHSHDYQRANNDDASRRATHRRGRTTWDPARHNSSAGVAMTARAAASRNLDHHIQRLQRLLAADAFAGTAALASATVPTNTTAAIRIGSSPSQ